jgi:hypothetical protein
MSIHVGLLCNELPGVAGLLFISSSEQATLAKIRLIDQREGLWVLTEATDSGNRAATTILLPSEY